MNLFVLESFISLDTLAPIIETLSKKKKRKICIMIINPLNDFSSLDLFKFIKGKIHSQINLPLNIFAKFHLFLLKKLFILPNTLLQKMGKIWHKYYGKNFSSNELIRQVLINEKISSITFEESLSKNLISQISYVSKDLKIQLIKVPSGLNTIKLPSVNNEFLKYCDYYIAPNNLRRLEKKINKNKILYLGSLRYRLSWLNKLRKIYKFKDKNKKLKVGILNKQNSKEFPFLQSLKKKFNNNNDVEIFESFKPRTRFPIQISKTFNKNYLTGHVIYNSKIILCARSSSVIIEGILNGNTILYLDFINRDLKKTFLHKYKIIKKIQSENEMFKFIKLFNFTKKKLFSKNLAKKFLINFKKEKKIEEDYIKLYESFDI